MRTVKRKLAVLLAVVMLLGLLPVTALAEDPPDAPSTEQTDVSNPDEEQADISDSDEEQTDVTGPDEEQETALSYAISEIGVRIGGEYVAATPTNEVWTDEPDDPYAVAPASLLPLKEYHYNLDLSGFLPAELETVALETVWSELEVDSSYYGSEEHTRPANVKVVWAKRSSSSWRSTTSYQFHLLSETGAIDLSPDGKDVSYSSYSNGYIYLQLIVGENAENQLDPNNVRYLIKVMVPQLHDLFSFSAETEDGPVNIVGTSRRTEEYWPQLYTYRLRVNHDQSVEDATLHISLKSAATNRGWGLKAVYPGSFKTESEALDSGTKDILKGGHSANYFKYPYPQFTAILVRDSATQAVQFNVEMYHASISVSFLNYPYEDVMDKDQNSVCLDYSYGSDYGFDEDGHYVISYIVTLTSGMDADETCYVKLNASNNEDSSITGVSNIKWAGVGIYDAPGNAKDDIKTSLFSDAGYGTDYSKGVTFTVFDIFDDPHYFKITTVAYEGPEPGPEPGPNTSANFWISSVSYRDGATSNRKRCKLYQIPGGVDSMVTSTSDMYQTILLLDADGNPVADGTTIYINFGNSYNATVHMKPDGDSGTAEPQGNNETEMAFKSGQALQYIVSAEDKEVPAKNYWVTFITPAAGKGQLFVIGGNVTEGIGYDKKNGISEREVHIGDLTASGGVNAEYYDILFINVGDTALTGLSAKLDDESLVMIDSYWNFTKDATLEGFTRVNGGYPAADSSYSDRLDVGILPNMGKIRLVPQRDKNGKIEHGEIDTTLTIGSSNGGEVKIKLTGITGLPSITTTVLPDGVKYVPYDQMITTNAKGNARVYFEPARIGLEALPSGVDLWRTGDLYGVPQAANTWEFTVNLYAYGSGMFLDSAKLTLTILDNTDDNVWNATDADYSVKKPVGTSTSGNHYVLRWTSGTVKFESHGEYGEFVAFYMDGERLVEGKDYESESGSTVITIYDETIGDAGTGTHTIAAEFHKETDENGLPNGTLKRSAQNYTVQVIQADDSSDNSYNPGNNSDSTNNNSSGNNSNNSSSNSSNSSSSNNSNSSSSNSSSNSSSSESNGSSGSSQPSASQPPASLPFTDVQPQQWFYEDIKWIYDKGWMEGISGDLFTPDSMVSQATIVTVLARMQNIDLTRYDGIAYDGIPAGVWYTNAAIWAKQAGLLPEMVFTEDAPTSRGQMAIMLVKYLQSLGVDTSLPADPVAFADADQMTETEYNAFQVLYRYGIFLGIGNYNMDPLGHTSRAQFAALIHRISMFMAG